jgi:hypothetical protein
MTGEPFIGFPVLRKGGVLWLACEGQAEVAIRITAAWETKGGTGKAPFAWDTAAPRLLEPSAGQILAAIAKHADEIMQREFGLPIAAVIIDTAGRAAGARKTGDLNDDANAKLIIKNMADASSQVGALFIGIAHFGKNADVGTKGSSSFEDDPDAVLALLGEKDISGIVKDPMLCARKYRSGVNGREFPFTTKVVDLGFDPNGRPVSTLTLEWETQDAEAAPKPKSDLWRAKSLRLLRKVMMDLRWIAGLHKRPAQAWRPSALSISNSCAPLVRERLMAQRDKRAPSVVFLPPRK